MKKIKHIVYMLLVLVISMYIIFPNNTTILADEDENVDVRAIPGETMPSCLENGGFELPVIPRVSSQVNKDTVPYWDTTAFTKKIELFKENTNTYIPGMKLTPREGKQAAELNADEVSSLYQNISTTAGKTYEWGISHRGRSGKDTMALIIGPRQDVEPASVSRAAQDQFMKMADWLKTQVDMDIGLDIAGRQVGCSKKIILYSKPFAGVGTFAGGDTNAFAWTRDDVRTEEWNVWLITSDNEKWEDYGIAAENPDYDFTFEVPEGCPESIFAFSAIQTASTPTVGNLIDNISFNEYYNVEVYTTPGGTGTYIYKDANNIDYFNNYTGQVLKNDNFTVMAHELTGADYRKFLGANINNEFVGVENFDPDGTGNYTYFVLGVDKHYKIRLIFSGGFITYDINVGGSYVPYDDYHYDGTANTNYEVPINSITMPTYTSHATEKYNADGSINDGWRFIGWKYANEANDIIFDGVHTFNYVPGTDPSLDTLTVSGNIVEGGTGEINNIPAINGATMVAQWRYRQAFIPRLFDNNTKAYNNNGECGSVSIQKLGVEDYEDVGEAYYCSNNELITVKASANEGYEFRGWHDNDGNLLSPNTSYSYKVTDGMVRTAYAHFVKVQDLHVFDKVTGNLGNKDKYFFTDIYLRNLESERTYTISYSNNGNVFNPNIFKSDASGTAKIRCQLKDGGCINLNGLLEGSTYRVLEDNYSRDGYTTTGTVPVATSLLAETSVTVINDKNTGIPLGVNNDGKPYLCMALVSMSCLIIVIIIYIKKRHKKSKE